MTKDQQNILRVLLALLLGLLLASPALAGGAQIIINSSVESYQLSANMDILEDPLQVFKLNDVVSGSQQNNFKSFTEDTANFGNTKSAFWFRTLLVNSTPGRVHIILEEPLPFIDSIDLFTPDPERPGVFQIRHGGDKRPFKDREVDHHSFLFNLTMAPGQKLPVYIRVASSVTLISPFTFWFEDAWNENAQFQAMVFGIFFGFLLVLILLSLSFYLLLRDPIYPLFALFSFSIALMFATTQGLSYKYLWPDSPWLAERMQVTSITFVMFAGTFYVRTFLNTRIHLPRTDRILRYFLILLGLIIGSVFVTENLILLATFSFILIQLYSPLLLFTGFQAQRKGVYGARLYLLAWVSSLTGAGVASLTIFGVLPYHSTLLHATSIGFLLDAGLLSLAMAVRVYGIRSERDLANQRAHDTLVETRDTLNSEVERRTRELIVAKREADNANQAKTHFLSNMSHELRTPLTSIVGYSQLLLKSTKGVLQESQRDNLTVIFEVGLHLGALIDDVLDTSVIESGNLKVNLEPVAFHTVVAEVQASVKAMAMVKSIQIIDRTSEKPPFEVIADRVRLRQVVTNLFTNAIKYSPEISEITFVLHRLEGKIRFTVTDNGPGILPEDLERIFIPFTRLDAMADKVEGLGIGLSITKNLIGLMAGEISVESRMAQGTSFHVDLVETAQTPVERDDYPLLSALKL